MFNIENLGKETGNHNEGVKSHFKFHRPERIIIIF